jgi:hypothetical protein
MAKMFHPLKGIKRDVNGRFACYQQDWIGGLNSGYRILAPTAYIFFASALPVITFGEQLDRDTSELFYISPNLPKAFFLHLKLLHFILLSEHWNDIACSLKINN